MVAADGLPQVGSKVRLNASTWNGPTEVEGVLLSPSAEGCITVKLLNGYNVTHRLDNITELEVVAGPDSESSVDEGELVEDDGLPVVFILHTGGTIASKVDYSTGAVTARFEPEELLAAVPELARHARIRTRKLGNMWSDDIRPQHWNRMASACAEAFAEGAAGAVITHGTDTMHISSAAVAYAFSGDGGKPAGRIAFTGSQRSSDRGSTDGAQNLIAAVHWAAHGPDPAGGCADSTAVIMHAGSDDGVMAVHPGCAVRKDHSSRRDAFQSVNQEPLAVVTVSQDGAEISLDDGYASRCQEAESREVCESPIPFSEDVRVLQLVAGSQLYADQIELAGSSGYDAILFHGTGLGHLPLDDPGDAPENTAVENALAAYVSGGGVAVVTTQCIRGPIHLDVYSKGRDQQGMGVLGHASTASPESALTKLHHLLSRGAAGDDLAAAWDADLVGENPDTI